MSDFNEWLDAALIVAGSNGMADSQVIPTWPADVADNFPALTVGALRKLHANREMMADCPPAASVNVVHGHRVLQWTDKPLPVGTKLYAHSARADKRGASVPVSILSDLRFALDDLEKGFVICESCGHQTDFEDSPLDCLDWVRSAWEYLDKHRPSPQQELPSHVKEALQRLIENGSSVGFEAGKSARDQHADMVGIAWNDPAVDPIVSKLYQKFKEWSQRGFTADDVTWCEVRGYVAELINARAQGDAEPVGVIAHTSDCRGDDPKAFVKWLFGGDEINLPNGTELYAHPPKAQAVPEGKGSLTEIYRRESIRIGHELNNLRSEYHNCVAELDTEIEDLREELRRVRRQPTAPVAWKECLAELIEAMRIYQMDCDEEPPYKHKAMMSKARALLAAAPQPPQEGSGDE